MSLALSSSVVTPMITNAKSVPTYDCDINGDRKTSAMDIFLIKKNILNVIPQTAFTFDINNDGSVNVLDALIVKFQTLNDISIDTTTTTTTVVTEPPTVDINSPQYGDVSFEEPSDITGWTSVSVCAIWKEEYNSWSLRYEAIFSSIDLETAAGYIKNYVSVPDREGEYDGEIVDLGIVYIYMS